MAERSYRGLFWSLVFFGTILDQSTKYIVFRWLYNDGAGDEYPLIPGVFKLLTQFSANREPGGEAFSALRTWSGELLPKVNHGALFGLGGAYITLANTIFAMVSIVAALAIAYWSTRPATARDRFLCIALGLIMAGTLGNAGLAIFSLLIGGLVATIGYTPFFICLGIFDLVGAAVLWSVVRERT